MSPVAMYGFSFTSRRVIFKLYRLWILINFTKRQKIYNYICTFVASIILIKTLRMRRHVYQKSFSYRSIAIFRNRSVTKCRREIRFVIVPILTLSTFISLTRKPYMYSNE